MGNGLNRERRREKQRVDEVLNETPPTALRVVRFENRNISPKPIAAGRSGTAVNTVQQPERSNGGGGTQAR
jgi:hypothetical protein